MLTILFLISYGLMTMLIVEQGATIESQRILIRDLFRDSKELSDVKMRAAQQERAQALAAQTQSPMTQSPSTQARTNQAPSSQATPQHRAQNQSPKPKPQLQMPSRPASEPLDSRRALRTI